MVSSSNLYREKCHGVDLFQTKSWEKILSLKRRNFLGGRTKLHNQQLLTIRVIKFIRNGLHVAHKGTINTHIKY